MRNTTVIGGSEAMPLATAKDTRVELRTNSTTKETLRSASALAGVDMSSFIIMAALEKAHTLIESQRMRTLSMKAWNALDEIINAPVTAVDDELIKLLNGERKYVRRKCATSN